MAHVAQSVTKPGSKTLSVDDALFSDKSPIDLISALKARAGMLADISLQAKNALETPEYKGALESLKSLMKAFNEGNVTDDANQASIREARENLASGIHNYYSRTDGKEEIDKSAMHNSFSKVMTYVYAFPLDGDLSGRYVDILELLKLSTHYPELLNHCNNSQDYHTVLSGLNNRTQAQNKVSAASEQLLAIQWSSMPEFDDLREDYDKLNAKHQRLKNRVQAWQQASNVQEGESPKKTPAQILASRAKSFADGAKSAGKLLFGSAKRHASSGDLSQTSPKSTKEGQEPAVVPQSQQGRQGSPSRKKLRKKKVAEIGINDGFKSAIRQLLGLPTDKGSFLEGASLLPVGCDHPYQITMKAMITDRAVYAQSVDALYEQLKQSVLDFLAAEKIPVWDGVSIAGLGCRLNTLNKMTDEKKKVEGRLKWGAIASLLAAVVCLIIYAVIYVVKKEVSRSASIAGMSIFVSLGLCWSIYYCFSQREMKSRHTTKLKALQSEDLPSEEASGVTEPRDPFDAQTQNTMTAGI